MALWSCAEKTALTVALSKGSGGAHYEAYAKWLKSIEPELEIIDLYGLDPEEAAKKLDKCSGLVLTGGPDVAPGRFGKAYDSIRCAIDYVRDTLEFAVLEQALMRKCPIFAICRGEQLMNVHFGGSLIVDIPEDFDTTVVHRCMIAEDCFHDVIISKGSILNEISGVDSGIVNTNHHQAVDRLSDDFVVSARTKDGLIEAYEWKEPGGKPFMIAVQWHPERLEKDNPLSGKIGGRFIEEMTKFFRSKRR